MTDAQIIAIAITVLAVLAGSVFNNVRISDLNSSLAGKINDTRDLLRAEMVAQQAHTELRFNSIDHKLDEILRMVGQHDTRIEALENRFR